MASSVGISFLLITFLLIFSSHVKAQGRCGIQGKGATCASLGQPNQCCSRFGYCGSTANHCGIGCQNGCPPPSPSPSSSSVIPQDAEDDLADSLDSIPQALDPLSSILEEADSDPQTVDTSSTQAEVPSSSSTETITSSLAQTVADAISSSLSSSSILPSSTSTSSSSSSPSSTSSSAAPASSPLDAFSQSYIYDDPKVNIVHQAVNSLSSQANSLASSANIGRCGRQVRGNLTCAQQGFPGQCCSEFGYCGSHADHCGAGCQSGCDSGAVTSNTATSIVADQSSGRCGTQGNGRTCSQQCCSAFGFCGLTDVHCGRGCQSGCTAEARTPISSSPTLPPPPISPSYPQPAVPASPIFFPMNVDAQSVAVPSSPVAASGMYGGCLGSGPTYQGAASIYKTESVDDRSCMYSEYRTPDSMDSYVAFLGAQSWDGVDACGGCLCVHGPNDYVVVKIVGQRPLMNSDMLLSEEAYSQIAPKTWDQASVSWQYIPCPISGPVSYYFRTGSDGLFPSVQVRNQKYRVNRMEIYKDNVWSDLTLSRGFWSRSLYGGISSAFSIRITSVTGETLMDRFEAYTPGRIMSGAANFS